MRALPGVGCIIFMAMWCNGFVSTLLRYQSKLGHYVLQGTLCSMCACTRHRLQHVRTADDPCCCCSPFVSLSCCRIMRIMCCFHVVPRLFLFARRTHLQITTCTTRAASRTIQLSTRNPFRHLKQQRKHHSIIRPSYQTTQHAQSRQHSRPHSKHADHTAGMSLMDFAGRIMSSSFFFSNFAHPHHPVYVFFQHVAYMCGFFSVRCDCSVHVSHMTRARAVSACVWFHVTHPPASVMCGQSRVNL